MWELWRQDDPGNVFLMATFRTEEEANAECARYEAKGHHQHYWVSRKQSDNN